VEGGRHAAAYLPPGFARSWEVWMPETQSLGYSSSAFVEGGLKMYRYARWSVPAEVAG
jgi:hypothetical protein